MVKKSPKKVLALAPETIRALDGHRLETVAGGASRASVLGWCSAAGVSVCPCSRPDC